MDISTVLAGEIRHLTSSVELDGIAIDDSLAALVGDLKLAILSFLGLELVLYGGGFPVRLTAFDQAVDAREVATSLQLTIAEVVNGSDPGRLTLYAAVPGAFVDLAADLAYALRLPDGGLSLDDGRPPSRMTSRLTGLTEVATINHALGILIEQGHHPDRAYGDLRRQATDARVSIHLRAVQLVAGARRDPDSSPPN